MGKRLLLADDSSTIQKVVGIIFSDSDYELSVVSEGEQVVSTANSFSPDLIMLDTSIKGSSGFDICRELRKSPALASVPVLFLTGAFEPFDNEKAQDSGGDDFIAKPFEAQLLTNKVEVLLSKPRAAASFSSAEAPPLQVETPKSPEEISPFDFSFTTSAEVEPSTLDIFATSSDTGSIDVETSISDASSGNMMDAFESTSVFMETSPVEEPFVPSVEPEKTSDFLTDAFSAPSDPSDIFSSGWSPEPEDVSVASIFETPDAEPEPVPEPEQTPIFSAEPPVAAVAISTQVEEQIDVAGSVTLSDAQLEKLVTKISRDIIERIAWEVVPDLAEIIIKEEIRKIKEGD